MQIKNIYNHRTGQKRILFCQFAVQFYEKPDFALRSNFHCSLFFFFASARRFDSSTSRAVNLLMDTKKSSLLVTYRSLLHYFLYHRAPGPSSVHVKFLFRNPSTWYWIFFQGDLGNVFKIGIIFFFLSEKTYFCPCYSELATELPRIWISKTKILLSIAQEIVSKKTLRVSKDLALSLKKHKIQGIFL